MSILDFNDIPYTDEQREALLRIEEFNIKTLDLNYKLCVKGYAGTGKTSIALNMIKWANHNGVDVQMLAPTNKAAMVLKKKTGQDVQTLHSFIYSKPLEDEEGVLHWKPNSDIVNRAMLLVDECSMIGEDLYNDLLLKTNKCLIIFLGDNFQLEPVGSKFNIFNQKDIEYLQLTEVKRYDSSILEYVTNLRKKRTCIMPPQTKEITLANATNGSLISLFLDKIAKEGSMSSVILCSTNKRRVSYNHEVRHTLNYSDRVLTFGEPLISINNSLYANGEIFVFENMGWVFVRHFATDDLGYAYLYKRPSPNNVDFIYLMVLPTVDKPSVYHAQLAKQIEFDLTTGIFKMNEEQYLELSREVIVATYGYCVSAHKSQGSQWDNVFVDQEYLTKLWDNARWLYTACTRAVKRLYVRPLHQYNS